MKKQKKNKYCKRALAEKKTVFPLKNSKNEEACFSHYLFFGALSFFFFFEKRKVTIDRSPYKWELTPKGVKHSGPKALVVSCMFVQCLI